MTDSASAIKGTSRVHIISPAIVFSLVFLIHAIANAQTVENIVASTGCAMAHCDQAMSDNSHLPAPSAPVALAWRDTTVNGSLLGLGCSSNSAVVACSFRASSGKPSELRVYAPDGTALWSSSVFGSNAYLSAPMVGPDNGVIMADQSRIVRFNSAGTAIWTTATPGGTPFSPTVTDDGHIFLAALNGPVSAYDFTTGAMVAQSRLNATIQYNGLTYNGFFDTMNTPAIKGNRIYVVTQFKYGTGSSLPVGRLIALDLVNGPGGYEFRTAWFVGFRAPSGASPTLSEDAQGRTVIFFDGAGTDPALSSSPRAFAVTDLGTSGQFLWNYRLSSATQTSPARDPRGGMWYFAYGSTNLQRLSETTGQVLQTLNMTTLMNLGTTYRPRSAMTISGNDAAPVLMVTVANTYFSRQYVVAIDLSSGRLLWRYRVDEGRGYSAMPWGQFPIVLNSSGEPVVVFSSYQNGVWALAGPNSIAGAPSVESEAGNGTDTNQAETEPAKNPDLPLGPDVEGK